MVETRELSSEQHTESDLDLGESAPAGPGSEPHHRLPFGVSARGLKGAAAFAGFVGVVVAAVIGGALAVDSVARFDDSRLQDGAMETIPPPTTPDSAATSTPEDDAKTGRTETADDTRKTGTTTASQKTTADDSAKSSSGGGTRKTATSDAEEDGAAQPKTRQVVHVAGLGVIKNLNTGLCVDLPDAGVPAAGGAISEYECIPGAGDNQDFQAVEVGDQVWLRNLKSNYCLDLPGAEAVDPLTVVLASPCVQGTSDNQMFQARVQGKGFAFVNVKSDLCLDVADPVNGNHNLVLNTCSGAGSQVWAVS
ncbi:ricin-type beta-trefoil lectin domain protein [Kineosporia sp. J2-2]|uniref:Ricin-type beta-trefoil lectin domain protein n=1 Tax=Kineosporia corallincola TaxID=2835133 RepID=A0ABS5TN68_9ACTN|nr:RICIN domain-containing protein [Kineosporia corallincola]MBT0772283.1 ricin-type beta-trefoil lectin domain protein [Kineosporia corallincola]